MIFDKENLRRLLCDGERFLGRASQGLRGPGDEALPGGEAGGVGPGLRRSSGIESDEPAEIDPPWTEIGVVARDELGLYGGIAERFPSETPFCETGVGGKWRESGEGSGPGGRCFKDV